MPAVPGAPAMPGVPAPGAPGAVPNPFAVLGQLAQMGAAMTAQPGGPVAIVNWRDLANALPAGVQGFEPDGDLDGSTGALGAMAGSEVRRRFRQGERRLEIKIVDTSFNQLLVMPFTMMRGMVVDSTEEIRRQSDVGGQPGVVEFRHRDRRGKQVVLAHGRFIVEVELEPSGAPEEVVAYAGLVNYALLGRLHAASQAAAATAAPAPTP